MQASLQAANGSVSAWPPPDNSGCCCCCHRCCSICGCKAHPEASCVARQAVLDVQQVLRCELAQTEDAQEVDLRAQGSAVSLGRSKPACLGLQAVLCMTDRVEHRQAVLHVQQVLRCGRKMRRKLTCTSRLSPPASRAPSLHCHLPTVLRWHRRPQVRRSSRHDRVDCRR